ncbi:MAG: S-formylglutathione hydrolase [Alphaproteobacteria bacterium]
MKLEKSHVCHGGTLGYYSHDSGETKTQMKFTVFLPPNASGKTPYMVFLSGLTCTEDNFTTKAGAYQKAAELGIAILAPDTSPRGDDVANDEAYDLGQGAGFYLNATQEPWTKNFRMESYIMDELLPLVETELSLDGKACAITGHSMGGHGALTLYFKYPEKFKSCSAFSPIVAPVQVPWGHKAFTAYLGEDQAEWKNHDACHLVSSAKNPSSNAFILIDQGTADSFLEDQLKPHLFEQACKTAGQPLTLRMQKGYDHSYFFIQSFIDDHIKFHEKYLK